MELQLSEVCTFVNGGPWSDQEYVESGIHVVKVTNMVNGRIKAGKDNYLPYSKYDRYKKHQLRAGDLIVATVGSHPTQPDSVVGRTAVVTEEFDGSFLNQNAVCIRVIRSDLVEPNFLAYLSKTVLFRHHIESRARGSANQVRMALGELKKFSFDYPNVLEQQKIAAILSAYDDLIENNNRRIALLEKMAEEIYREWFVRLRFPGHDSTPIRKGIPEGWQVGELQDISVEGSVSTEPGEHLSPRDYVPIDLLQKRRVLPESSLPYTEAKSSLVLFEERDILFGAMRPYQHKVCIAPFSGVTRSTCLVIRPLSASYFSYLYWTLFQPTSIEYATLICNGADRPYVVWRKGLERMPLFVPPENLASRFNEVCQPIFDEIMLLFEAQNNLAQTRDLLLGRLISGKLSVKNLDIRFPPGMREDAA